MLHAINYGFRKKEKLFWSADYMLDGSFHSFLIKELDKLLHFLVELLQVFYRQRSDKQGYEKVASNFHKTIWICN